MLSHSVKARQGLVKQGMRRNGHAVTMRVSQTRTCRASDEEEWG